MQKLSGEKLAHFRRTQLGFIFQDYNLLDTLTLGENIVLPLLLEGKQANDRLYTVLKDLDITALEGRFPYQVSGGQQQRAAVARAIIHQPALVLADEPSGNLDSKASANLLNTFSNLNQQQDITFIMVTHDPQAASYAKRVIFIKDGKLYKELHKSSSSNRAFYSDVLSVLARLEEDVRD
jgi:putative ABC transport system ATP-binding protein